MNARGVVVMGLDMQGHGHSEGERALALSHEHLVEDICQFIHHIYEDDLTSAECRMQLGEGLDLALLVSLRDLPFFLMGSSMGGAVSTLASLQLCTMPQYIGCTLLAPFLGNAKLPHWLLVEFFKYTFAYWTPNSHMPSFLSNISDNTLTWTNENDILLAEMDAWGNEGALGFGQGMKWGTANMFLSMGPHIVEKFKEINYPFLILHDPADEICSIDGSHNMMKHTSTPDEDKKVIEVNGFLHGMIYNNPEEVCDHVVEWIQSRVAKQGV
jgi:alpha-beta hydrolase superfamily lysophospholipase